MLTGPLVFGGADHIKNNKKLLLIFHPPVPHSKNAGQIRDARDVSLARQRRNPIVQYRRRRHQPSLLQKKTPRTISGARGSDDWYEA
jgi:hypothetical protein